MEGEQCDGGGTVGWRGNSVMEGDQEDLARLVYIIHSYTHTHTQTHTHTHTHTLTKWHSQSSQAGTRSSIHLVTQRDIENVQLTGASDLLSD